MPVALIDLPYAIACVFFGVAVLHPSIRELSVPVSAGQAAPSRGRLAFVAVALAIPAVVTLSQTNESTADRIVLTAIVASLTAIAIWRVFRACVSTPGPSDPGPPGDPRRPDRPSEPSGGARVRLTGTEQRGT